jgi:hypothetical protein
MPLDDARLDCAVEADTAAAAEIRIKRMIPVSQFDCAFVDHQREMALTEVTGDTEELHRFSSVSL